MEIKKISFVNSLVYIEYTKLNLVTNTQDFFIFESREQPAAQFKKAMNDLSVSLQALCELSEKHKNALDVRSVTIRHAQDDIVSASISATCNLTGGKKPFHVYAELFHRERDNNHITYMSICDVHNEAEMYLNGVREQPDLFTSVAPSSLELVHSSESVERALLFEGEG